MQDLSPLTGVQRPVATREKFEDRLTPQEIRVVIFAIQRRLYSLGKTGVPKIEDVMTLPSSGFYPYNQSEVAALQRAGEKLCRMNLGL